MPKALIRALLTAALIVTLPGAVLAQDGSATPEGTTWHLTAYAGDGMASVPFFVQATLELQDGTASGRTGCNDYSGSYELDGASLDFEQRFITQAACPDDAQALVQAGYLGGLSEVAAWSMEEEQLILSDADGAQLLVFEEPSVALSRTAMSQLVGLVEDQAAQMADQQDRIDRLGERVDNIRVGTLRDRIKELEAAVATLQAQAAAAANSGTGSGSNTRFSAAEKVLLRAIPPRVERTCRPLRSGLPRGTVAAVACDGSRRTVAQQAYYLMEWKDAVATLRSVAADNGVPRRNPRCFEQRAGWIHYGTNLGAEACWSEGGTGNYRLVTMATECKQLNVDGTRLRHPAIYLAMEGVNDRMEPVRAAGLAYTDAGYLLMNFEAGSSIPARGQPDSPGCKARLARNPGL